MLEPPPDSVAPSTLPAAAITPGSARVDAFGSDTLRPPTGTTPATCWSCVVQGVPVGFATTGSDAAAPATLALAALPRHVVGAACAVPAPAVASTSSAPAAPA